MRWGTSRWVGGSNLHVCRPQAALPRPAAMPARRHLPARCLAGRQTTRHPPSTPTPLAASPPASCPGFRGLSAPTAHSTPSATFPPSQASPPTTLPAARDSHCATLAVLSTLRGGQHVEAARKDTRVQPGLYLNQPVVRSGFSMKQLPPLLPYCNFTRPAPCRTQRPGPPNWPPTQQHVRARARTQARTHLRLNPSDSCTGRLVGCPVLR